MGRRNRKKPLFESVLITDIGSEGKALGKVNDKVIFTPFAIPGDVVDLQVTKKRSKFFESRVVKYHELSKDRIEPVCEHFGVCGGCKWQMLPYDLQLKHKQKQVIDQLVRIGKLELPEVDPILGSEKTTFYRNKLEFTFSTKRWFTFEEIGQVDQIEQTGAFGFHIPGLFDKILDINKCWLQPEPSNAIRNKLREYAIENELNYHFIKENTGFLRNIIIRTSSTGEVMLIVIFREQRDGLVPLMEFLKNEFPEITSLQYVINGKGNDSITDQEVVLFHGRDHIFEEMEGLKFKIGPKSFYQTNSDQAYELYKITREFAGLKGDEVVYDLYTGTGTIANFVASKAKEVIGLEYVPEAIADARVNSNINGIENTKFFAGDMKDVLTNDFINEHGKPDVIITDPPRSGMHADVIETILNASPEKIVYVSCNPATQARDVAMMEEQYKVVRVRPVDMFPHTHHVENVILLEKR